MEIEIVNREPNISDGEKWGPFTEYGNIHPHPHDATIRKFGPLPLKWPGGKRHMLPHLTGFFSEGYNKYFEPFFGGGAAYFAFSPRKSLISDSNPELIGTYKALKDDPEGVHRLYQRHRGQHGNDYYYFVRASRPRSPHGAAARIIYLNQACFNGLYRVNQQGNFNVPIGSKTPVDFGLAQFIKWGGLLQGSQLRVCDFEKSISSSKAGDLIFADPPYALTRTGTGFLRYNEKIFSWEDQLRLFHCLKSAMERGVRVVATNAYDPAIWNLYCRYFSVRSISTKSYIAADAASRGEGKEILING